jgi:MraZ protein
VEKFGAKWSHLVLRGNYSARIDDKGRLKVPNAFLALLQDRYGPELFVTSLTGECVWIYPLQVWSAIEEKLAAVPSTHPARLRFLNRVNYYGQTAELDKQGRVIIHARLRESASMSGEVDVFGQQNYLDVWNHERFLAKLQSDPFTEADAKTLSDLGI